MIYTGNFRQNATWVQETTEWFVNNSQGAKVWTGLQGYTVNDIEEEVISNSPVSQLSTEIKAAQNGGSMGAIIFRFGVCNNMDFVNLPVDEAEFSTFNNLDYVISCSRNLAVLDRDFIFNATHDTGYVNGIGIHRSNLAIDGAGHTIDGLNLARMFNITGKNITFKNIVFKNGCSSTNGGVIYCLGNNLTIINCTFTNCSAQNDAGAVFAKSNYTQIINSTFIGNDAVYNGAVYINGVGSSIINSNFKNNSATISAGAVGWAKKDNGLIKNCTFIANKAYNEGGGAIFWNQGKTAKSSTQPLNRILQIITVEQYSGKVKTEL